MNNDTIMVGLIFMAICAVAYALAWIATRRETRRRDKMRAD